MDFSKTLFRSSSIGYLLTEPQTKADKEAGLLSKTAQKHLLEVYISQKYGRYKDIQTKQMKKGIEVEQESVGLLNSYLGKQYSLNDDRFNNDFITGKPDIISLEEKRIIDIKSSYDLWTFIANLPDKLDSLYYAQMQSYMWLTGMETATIAYCLVNTPESIINQEKYYLLKSMDVISEESPEYVKEALKLEANMRFDDIDIQERVLMFNVERDEDFILKIQYKVEKGREFLAEIEEKHLNFNGTRN